jgi:hypothetical protein
MHVKKLTILSISFVVVFLMFGVASAASYWFYDTIDNWSGYGGSDWAPIPNYPGTFEYQHDIRDDVDFAAGDLVTQAYLALDFDFDWDDSSGTNTTPFGYTVAWDNTEYSWIQFNSTGWQFIDEVDNNFEFLTIGIDWLNEHGILDVTLTVCNPLGTAQAWLDSSTLFGSAQTADIPAPVPESSTMILLGMGLIGIAVPGRKKFIKKN